MRPIDADELKDGFNTHFVSEKYGYEKIDVREVIERIDAMPTLDDAPAPAHWKKAGGYGCYCSICGQRVRIKNGESPRLKSFYKYCPNCGAAMQRGPN